MTDIIGVPPLSSDPVAPLTQDPRPQAPAPATPAPNPVAVQQDPASRDDDALARFTAALQSDPELAAEARRYGMQFGTSVEWTQRNIKAARQMMQRRKMTEYAMQGKLTPGATELLKNEWDAKASFDQLQQIGFLDRLVGAFESGVLQSRIGLLQDNLANDIPLTQEELRSLEEWKKQLEKLPQTESVTLTGIVSGFSRVAGQQTELLPEGIKTGLATGVGGALSGSTVPGFGTAVGFTTGFGFGLAGGTLNAMRRMETGSAYSEFRAMGYTHEASAAAAKKVGWINMGIEAVGTAVQFGRPLLAPLKKRVMGEVADMLVKPTMIQAARRGAVNLGLGVVSQGAEEGAQELAVLIGQTWAKEQSLRQGADPATLKPTAFESGEAVQRILDAAVQGAIASVIPSAAASGYRLYWDAKQAKSAANQKDFIRSISANASQQELLKRAPDLLTKALAATMRGTSAETMYFDSRLLLQAVEKLDQQQNEKTAVDGTPRMSAADQLERAFPGLLERARAAVGDVTIPTAEWVKLSGTDLGNELMQYATLDPDTPSPHEAGIAKGQAGSEALKQRSDQLLQQAEKMASEDEALAKDIAKAKLDVTKQLVEAGAYSARESKLFSELLVAHATVYGKKLGLTPTQFFAKYPLPKTVVAPESPAQAGEGEVESQQAPPPDAGVFDAANPPAPLDGAARGPVVMAVMTYDGKVYYDRNATMHGELADKFPEIADSIIDGGFIRDGKYVMGMSDGGYSAFEGDEDMVARARMFTEQVNSQGGELRSQDAMQRPASPIPMSALNVLHSDSKLLARPEGKQKKTKAIVAAEIKQVALAHWGVEVNSKMLEEAHDEAVALRRQIDEARAADAGADVAALEKRIDDLMQIEREITANLIDEAIAALRASNRNAADWYTTAIEAALAAAAVIHPELADDAVARQIPAFANEPNPAQAARFVLRSALAITSQNNTVADNTKYAEQVYANFVATGLFNAGEYGSKKGGINGNLLLFNELLPLIGSLDELEDFARSEYTVRDLEAMASRVLGRKVTIEGRKDDVVNGSAVFGPKIGQGFLQNLLGNFNPVTIDLWMRRTWGRLTGDVVGDGITGEAGVERLANFIAGMRAAGKKLPPELSRLKVYESVGKTGAVSRSMSKEVESRVEEEESLRSAAAQAARAALKEWDQLYKLMRLPITPAMRAEAPLSQVMKMNDEQRTALFDSLVARLRSEQKALDRAFDKLNKKALAALDAEWGALDSAKKKKAGTKRGLWMSKRYEAAGRTTTFERSDQLPEFNNEGTDSVISELTPLWASAAKTIKANLEPIDIPSPSDRRVISRVVNEVRKGLAEQGIVVTNADVQAILWYPEKDLWSKLQGDKDNDLNKSYDDEFLRIAAERGLGAEAQAAVDAVRARRAGDQQVAGAMGVDGADGRSAKEAVRGRAGQAVPGEEGASGEAAGQVGGELRSRDSSPVDPGSDTTPAPRVVPAKPDSLDSVKGVSAIDRFPVSTKMIRTGKRQMGAARINSPQDLANAMAPSIGKKAVEHLDIVVTDKRGKPLAVVASFKGGVNHAPVDAATIVHEVSRVRGAAYFWMVHNHPSGQRRLSEPDMAVGQRFAELFRGSGIESAGIMAISSSGEWEHAVSFGYPRDVESGMVADVARGRSIPVMEREIARNDVKPIVKTGRPQAHDIQAAGRELFGDDRPGLIFFNTHVQVAGFVELDSQVGRLRGTPTMGMLYRAGSVANAHYVTIHNVDKFFEGNFAAANLASFFEAHGVELLDAYDSGKLEPFAETAADRVRPLISKYREFYSRDSTPRPLFSALERAIASTPPGAMSARQWSAQLDRLVRTGAVKEQERFWSGIDEWLNLTTDEPGFVEFDDEGSQVRKMSRAQYLERLRTDPDLESRVEPEPDSGTRQISRVDVVEFLRANKVEVMSGEERSLQTEPDAADEGAGSGMWVVSTQDDGVIGEFDTFEEAEEAAEEWKQGYVDGVLDSGIEVLEWSSSLIPESMKPAAREGDVAISVNIPFAAARAKVLARHKFYRDDLRGDNVNSFGDHVFLFRDEEAATNFRIHLLESDEIKSELMQDAAQEVAISDPSEARSNEPSPSEPPSFAEYSAGANLPGGVRGQEDYRNVGIVLGGRKLFEAPWTHSFKEAEGGVSLDRNRLAHYRASTRKVDGEGVMFVEEVQTDWGQQGRDIGFYPRNADSVSIGKADRERRDRKQRVLAEMEAIRQKAKDKGVPEWTKAFMSDADERQDWSSVGMAAEAARLREMAAQEAQLRTSPDAQPNEGPFVTKTDDWATLALKHIVMDAAKRGQRKIVFVNGEQAAAMFSLSSVFNRVSWQDGDNLGIYKQITFHRDSLGTGVRLTVTKDGTVISANADQVIGEKLSAVAGSEIAEKILSQWDTPRADNPRIFSGEMAIDATIGGEGMHTFYGNQDGQQSTPAGALQTNKNGEPMPAILPKVLRELAAKIGAKVVEGVQVDDLYGKNLALELTDETMRVLTEEGMPLFARAQDRRTLGSFSPSANRITLYKGYNRGTWLHEWGHYWLESTSAIVAGGNAPAELVADLGSLLDWFGIQPTATQSRLEVWAGMDLEARRKYHEKFAYHFEIYLAKGEAPSPELEGTFARIGAWIRDVYRSLQEMVRRLGDLYREEFGEDLGVLSPEAQRVMDRIFAVDEDIERAAVERELRPMFQTREEALAGGMSEAAWDEYQADLFLAKERAKDELIAASDERARSTMNRARRESLDMKAEEAEAREEMQPQVEAEVQGERVVRARRWLRKGEVVNADGSVTKMPTVQKLHRGAVKALLGIGTDKPKVSDEQFGKLRGMLADDGVDPNEVAPLLRYDTGEQLVRDLIDQPSEQEMVGVRVEARMRREYPELFDANVRRNRIERAIANDLRMGTLANELLHLQRAILTSPAVGALAGPAKAAFDEANRLEAEQKSLREQANELDLLADAGILTDALALRAQANKLTDRINRLRRGSGGEQTRRTILSVVRNAAAANLRSRQIRDISPRALNAAAARMGRETMAALKEGNFVAAIDAKRRQMVLTEMARQAVDVADEVSSILRMARSFAKPDERLAKTHTMPLIYVGRVVLSAYGLRDPERDVPTGRDPALPTRIDEAMASVREMNEALANELAQDVVTPMIVAATGDYRDLTLEQFRVLRDNLEMLWYRSRNERFTLVEGQKQSLDETVELLLAAPGAVAPDRPAVGVQSGGTKWDEVVHDLLAGKAARKRVEHWCIQMDGGQPGWWHRAVFQRLADAETLAEQYERKWVTRAASILQRLVPLMRHEPITWQLEEGRTYTFGARGSVVGRTRNGPATAELFMAIMHAQGNRSNKEKLLLDPRRGWGSQDIDPMTGERSLNSAAWDTFFAEQVRAGVITKEMLDIAQEIGDLHEEMKPFLQQAHIEAFGFPFGTVEPSPFEVTFPDGTTASYRGWYLPAKADRLLVQDADLQAEDALVEARTSLAQTPRDMTKARDPNTFRSLSLQLSMLPGHIRESARFAAMGPAIVDVMKLLNKRKLKARLDAINPRLRANMLQPWVKNAALLTTSLRDESDTPLANKFMRRLDRGFTYLTMFGNLVNAVQNPVQLVPALTVLIADHGAGAVGAVQSAAASYGRNPMRMARVIRSMSSFMDGRGNEEVRQANKRIEKMLRDDVGKLGKLVDMRNDYEQYLLDSTYVLQSMTQHVGDQIAWKAAYSLEVKKHDDPEVAERRAVAYADSVVRRTQGSLRATDKSASEVTTPWKAFLNKFSGYFVQMANLSSSMIGAVRQQAGTRNRRIKYLGLYLGLWGIPFALSALIAKAGMGALTDDDDKDGEWWDDLAWDILLESQVRPLFPLFGAVGRGAEMVVNIVDNDQGTMARMPSPAPFAALERAAKGVARALDGKPATTMDGGDIATVLTLLVLPVPLPKQAGYLIDAASGDVEPTVRGAITGRAAKDEKR